MISRKIAALNSNVFFNCENKMLHHRAVSKPVNRNIETFSVEGMFLRWPRKIPFRAVQTTRVQNLLISSNGKRLKKYQNSLRFITNYSHHNVTNHRSLTNIKERSLLALATNRDCFGYRISNSGYSSVKEKRDKTFTLSVRWKKIITGRWLCLKWPFPLKGEKDWKPGINYSALRIVLLLSFNKFYLGVNLQYARVSCYIKIQNHKR